MLRFDTYGLWRFLSGEEQLDNPKRLRSAAWLALIILFFLILDILVGVGIYYYSGFGGTKTSPLVDAFYLSSVTASTTGYGDVVPTSFLSKMLTVVYIILNASSINYLISPSFNRFIQFLEGREMPRSRRIGWCMVCSVLCMAIGVIPFAFEEIGWRDVPYAVIVSFTSTGYGDFAFETKWGRIIGAVWLLISYLLNYRLGSLVFEAGDNSYVEAETAERSARETEEREEVLKAAQERSAREREEREEVLKVAQENAQEQIAKSVCEQKKAERAAQEARDEADKTAAERNKALQVAEKAEAAAKDALSAAKLATARLESLEGLVAAAKDALSAAKLATARLESLEGLVRAHSTELEELRRNLRDAQDNMVYPEIG